MRTMHSDFARRDSGREPSVASSNESSSSLPLKREQIIALLLLLVPNLIAWVLLFPGYFQADHQLSMAKFINGSPDLWHSIVWTVLAYPLIYLSPSYALYGLLQIALFVACAYCSISRLVRLGLLRRMVPLAAVFGLFPAFVLYNELYSSDICFAVLLISLTSMLVEIVETRGEAFRGRGFCIRLLLVCFFVVSLRKNAVLAGVVLCIVVPLTFRSVWKRALLAIAGGVVAAVLLDAALSPVLGVKQSPSQELLSVPSLQIAATYNKGGVIPEDANRYFTAIRSEGDWAKAYSPDTADAAKQDVVLTPEFVWRWAELGLRNPGIYFRTYTQLEYPFWSLVNEGETYMGVDFACNEEFTHLPLQSGHESYAAQFDGVEAKSTLWRVPSRLQFIVEQLRLPVLTDLYHLVFFNRGLPFWVVAIGIILSRGGSRRGAFSIVAIPVICVIVSLLVFAPVPLMRYAMQSCYSLPVLLVYLTRRTGFWARKG